MFNFYNFDTLVTDSCSCWFELLITLIGTFLGFIGAFYLTRWTERKQENKKKIEIFEKHNSRIKYLTLLLESSLKVISEQLNHFEKLAKEIASDPVEIQLLDIESSNDLFRLQSMDTEELYNAYYEIVPENPDKIKDYKNIFNCIDFLYLRIKQEIEASDRNVNYMHRDQMYIKEKIDGLADEIYKHIKAIELRQNNYSNLPYYQFLVKSHERYMSLVNEEASLGVIETEFIAPFGSELNQQYSKEPSYGSLYDLASKGIVRYNHIKKNSSKYAIELNDIRKEVNEMLELLKKIKDKLKNINEP